MKVRSILTMLAAVAALAASALRIPSIAEPLGIDQSLWASAARAMARHQLLYRDVWEQRPPGIYFTYLTGFRVFGWTPAAVAWMDILASAATTLLLFAIVHGVARSVGQGLKTLPRPDGTRRESGFSTMTGAVAAALYATLTMPGWLYRHDGFLERSVCETFIVVCVALAAWCAVKWREPRGAFGSRTSDVYAFGVGFFGGAAVVYKPNAGLYLPALLLWMWFYRWPSITTREGVRAILVAGAAAVVAPALTLLWLWRLDLLGDARVAVVDFNRFYVSQGLTLTGYAVDFSKAIWLRMKTEPLWTAGGIGSLAVAWEFVRRRALDPLAGLAVLWGAAAALVIVVNGARLFNTYFIQALAPLAVLAAWILVARPRESVGWRVVSAVTAALMLTLLVQRHYVVRVFEFVHADLAVMRGTMDRSTYLDRFGGYGNDRGYSARANEELAGYVRQHTAADDRIFLFGINGAGVYFLSDRLTAHRFLRVNFFVPSEFPNPDFTLAAVVSDLAARRPRYLIFEQLHSSSEMGRMVDALRSREEIKRLLEPYRLETTIEDFSVYRLQDIGRGL